VKQPGGRLSILRAARTALHRQQKPRFWQLAKSCQRIRPSQLPCGKTLPEYPHPPPGTSDRRLHAVVACGWGVLQRTWSSTTPRWPALPAVHAHTATTQATARIPAAATRIPLAPPRLRTAGVDASSGAQRAWLAVEGAPPGPPPAISAGNTILSTAPRATRNSNYPE